MQWRMALGLGLGVSLAIACSSSGNNQLGSQGGSSSGGGVCGTLGTSVSDGAGYVKAEKCQICHGQDMAGVTTPITASQDPGITIPPSDKLYPPNLTPDPATGIGKWTDVQISSAITMGVDNNGLKLCPEMGQHYPNMCPNEVTGIIAYLHSLPAVSKTIPGSICPPLKSGP